MFTQAPIATSHNVSLPKSPTTDNVTFQQAYGCCDYSWFYQEECDRYQQEQKQK